MNTFREVWAKLINGGPAYRRAFVASQVKRLIPFQIYALRKKRGWSQKQLAKQSGLTQGVISRAEDPDYGNLTFNTVISIAGGFDVAFVGKFVPFGELADFFVTLSEESAGAVPSFEEEAQAGITAQTADKTYSILYSLYNVVSQRSQRAVAAKGEKEEGKVISIDAMLVGNAQESFERPHLALT